MAKHSKKPATISLWSFRREISLGTLVHMATILIFLAAGWTNLQKELVLIRHNLNELIAAQSQLQSTIKQLATRQQKQEYKISVLQDKIEQMYRRMKDDKDNDTNRNIYCSKGESKSANQNPDTNPGKGKSNVKNNDSANNNSSDSFYIVGLRKHTFCPW